MQCLQNAYGNELWTLWACTHCLQHSREHHFSEYYIYCGQKSMSGAYPMELARCSSILELTCIPVPGGTTRESLRHKDGGHNCIFIDF